MSSAFLATPSSRFLFRVSVPQPESIAQPPPLLPPEALRTMPCTPPLPPAPLPRLGDTCGKTDENRLSVCNKTFARKFCPPTQRLAICDLRARKYSESWLENGAPRSRPEVLCGYRGRDRGDGAGLRDSRQGRFCGGNTVPAQGGCTVQFDCRLRGQLSNTPKSSESGGELCVEMAKRQGTDP